MAEAPTAQPRILVLADDLIWSTRLTDLLRGLGVESRPTRGLAAFRAAFAGTSGALVDLTARAYDGVAAVEAASAAGLMVACLAQHDDAALRRRALAAGADRVFPYRLLAERGPAALGDWLDAIRASAPPRAEVP